MLNKYRNILIGSLTILIIIVLGLLQSTTIMGGDQSLFAVIAKLVDSGKVLYKDMFDYKQPGIYMFYLLAGNLFGWDEIGIHIFELIYWIIFSLLLIYQVRKNQLFDLDYINYLLPLFIVGVYYCNGYILHLTQLEILVTFPLFLIVWLLNKIKSSKEKWFINHLLIGFFTAIVVLCKLIYSPILLLFFAIHFLYIIKTDSLKNIIIKQYLPLILGFIIPVGVFLGYVFMNQIQGIVYEIYFKIPSMVVGISDQVDPKRLFSSINWFMGKMEIFLFLAFIGIVVFPKKERFLLMLLLSWIIGGFFVILLQKTSWWEYHFQLLYLPIAILAAKGIDFIIQKLFEYWNPQNKLLKYLAIVAFFIILYFNQILTFSINTTIKNSKTTVDYTKNEIKDIKDKIKPEDTVFVCGNPRLYLLTDHLPQISINGWILEYYLDFQWKNFYHQLTHKPPTYLYIGIEYDKIISNKNNELWNYIIQNFEVHNTTLYGNWYKRKTE